MELDPFTIKPKLYTFRDRSGDTLKSIEIKSTGQLIDESQVVWLKIQHGAKELLPVYKQYEEAVAARVLAMPDAHASTEPGLRLMRLNAQIWDLISEVMKAEQPAIAVQIQMLNKERVKCIAEINWVFGDADQGQVRKIY